MMLDHIQAQNLLDQYGGNVTRAAREAGISRATWRCRFGSPKIPHRVEREHLKQDVSGVGLIVADAHFPHEDEECLDTIARYVNETEGAIDYLIFNGDMCDFHRISRWDKDPFDSMPFHEEIEYSAHAIEKFSSKFKVRRRKVYIKGNHEDRLQRYLWSRAPEISKLRGLTVPEQLGLDSLGFEWVDNLKLKSETKRFFHIGKLNILHGHELAICPRINPARHFFLRALDNLIVGHVHKPDVHHAKDISDKPLGAWTVGACCNMHPTYRPQNEWKPGFAVVKWDADGKFTVENHEIVEGVVR